MGSGLLMERQLINLTGVSMGQLKYLYANRRDMANKILDSVIEDNKYDYLKRIDIAETGGATVDDIMQLLDTEPECDYAVIDYVQMIKGKGSEKEVLDEVCSELQIYARRTGKRLIVCCQARRPTTQKGITDDAGSAAKGSANIEQTADVGLLLSELFENGDKKILATLFKNRYGAKQKTYKYRLDERLNIKLEEKDYE
jgi:replicative DNA helicase